jgi:hypothetical protein
LLTKVIRFTTLGVIIIAAIVAGAYLVTHSKGDAPIVPVSTASPQTGAGGTPPTPSSSASTKATSGQSRTKGGTASTVRYVLSTPATAGGYPMGQDPQFLATARSTARTILSAVLSGGGGKVQGSPVSASYLLPTNSQVLTFVGYRGTFDPAKVIAGMGSFGTTDGTYHDAKTGDSVACANTASSPSGAVCVWATKTTLGVTEFFSATGPETLTSSQYRGAADTEKLRASVETKKS